MRKELCLKMVVVALLGLSFLMPLTGCQSKKDKQYANGKYWGNESAKERNKRMKWWREARFGMFIHWGLYSIPAGEWNGQPVDGLGEWIMNAAKISVADYEPLAKQFNPVQFNANEWVTLAKEAGVNYIVITSKHHDGFCLFGSEQTDYDILDASPFKRDILKELSDECRKQGIVMCWYHSIMDWHHPDYMPRREWDPRPGVDSNYSQYIRYMKNQLRELVGRYGRIGVLWFDGEWEKTWTHEMGVDLYNYVRSLQPDIIINNRVDKGREGMAGLTKEGGFAGDFGTPEQEIPATGIPGADWETCMTMNDTWGFKKNDTNWKSPEDLIHKLIDIASKGGNFLLNVGPTAEGVIPQESVDRLRLIGAWMSENSESIYGTRASIFENLPWGRCTVKEDRVYLHVFDWPADGKLVVPAMKYKVKKAYLLADPKTQSLEVEPGESQIIVNVPTDAPDPIASVVVLKVDD